MRRLGIIKFLIFSLLVTHSVLGADVVPASYNIRGHLIDKKGEAIIGASVQIENTLLGTTSDLDGNFTLKNVSGNQKVRIKVSYVGYKSIVREIKSNADFNLQDIVLEEDALGLDEITIVGYTQTKRNFRTGAISSVTSDKINSISATSFSEQIQGQVPGVIISGTSGTPGSNVFIRLRGTTSINAGNNPLYIIDGVPFNSNALQAISIGGQTINPLSDINPADIEKVEILKDANATAIYGSRGANGVILVTTKRGDKNKKTKVFFSTELGWAKAVKLWNLATGPEHGMLSMQQSTRQIR